MRDLKQLLEPLEERPMPERWEEIRRRNVEPLPEPHRSRLSAYVTAGAVALLSVAVIAWISPLGGGNTPLSADAQPPAWLVDNAYELAYSNGDLIPDDASWVLSHANTVASAVDSQSGDPTAERYLVVLHGRFTAFAAKTPRRGDLPTGRVLVGSYDPASHELLDWGVGNQEVDVPGLASFALPPSSAIYAADAGWTAAVPPGWQALRVDVKDPTSQQVVIANADPSAFAFAVAPVPQVTTINFPTDGVALMVTMNPGTFSDFPVVSPPVSLDDAAVGSAGAGGSTLDIMFIQGPTARFAATVREGPDASQVDIAAIEAVVASLAFPGTEMSAPTTTSTESSVLPSADTVVDGRFVVPVQLDDGMLRVDPLPDATIPDGAERAADLLWASRLFADKDAGVVGYGLITLEGGQDGKAAVDQVPGWIAFGWGGSVNCPMMTAPPSPTDLPSNGYVAVAILPNDGLSDFSYEARAQVCDAPVHGPVIGMATHVESIAWTQDAPATADGVRITYTPAPCGYHEMFNASGGPSGTTLSVEMSVPDAAMPCSSPSPVSETLTGPGYGTGSLEHGDLGLIRQATFAT